ncbi:unnamed protein product [Pseudo-nitzschia multistriata]|uniref:N-acetyltransferase domain-containing protein n=1 Tax=Pseudo-nitzschia multistriata TaxID=183589 RepID=A0A448Z8N6_9STRA|nr:unnamed protein product [Pseudo-nitzschia multistriata]
MKLNYETCLVGEKVVLVPYRPQHVPVYHEWMKDPALLEATGSEPLSYEEEVEMQKDWRDDDTKCTFIVHVGEECRLANADPAVEPGEAGTPAAGGDAPVSFSVGDNLGAMIGDVNLFLSEMDDGDDDGDGNDGETDEPTGPRAEPAHEGAGGMHEPGRVRLQAEIDIMIARSEYRRRGLGRKATCAMLRYGARELGIQRFFCRINEDNTDSIRLFRAIGFEQCGYAACFRQVELELRGMPRAEMEDHFEKHGGAYKMIPCDAEEE